MNETTFAKVRRLNPRRKIEPVPVILALGMPDSGGTLLWSSALLSGFSGGSGALPQVLRPNVLRLEAPVFDEPDPETCPQCILLSKVIASIEEAIPEARRREATIWVEVPVLLEPQRLILAFSNVSALAQGEGSPSFAVAGAELSAVVGWIRPDDLLKDVSEEASWARRLSEFPRHWTRELGRMQVLETLGELLEVPSLFLLTEGSVAGEAGLGAVRQVLRSLNPEARLMPAERISEALLELLKVPPEAASPRMGEAVWRRTLRSRDRSRGYYRAERPFHPARLLRVVERWPEWIIRSVGTLWLASDSEWAIDLNHLGPVGFHLAPQGFWTGDPSDPACTEFAVVALAGEDDVRGELRSMRPAQLEALFAELDRCLLSDLEMKMDWKRFENPFPILTSEEDSERGRRHELCLRVVPPSGIDPEAST